MLHFLALKRIPQLCPPNKITLGERLQVTRITLAAVLRTLEWKVFWTFLER